MSEQPRITKADLWRRDPLAFRDLENLHRQHLQKDEQQDQFLIDPRYTSVNAASIFNGAVGAATSTFAGFNVNGCLVGDRKGLAWGVGTGWTDNTLGVFPDTATSMFAAPCLIDRFDLVTAQDTLGANAEDVTPQLTFTLYGLTSFSFEYMNNAGAWIVIAAPTTNTLVWNSYPYTTPVLAQGVRCVCNNGADGLSHITSMEAWLAK